MGYRCVARCQGRGSECLLVYKIVVHQAYAAAKGHVAGRLSDGRESRRRRESVDAECVANAGEFADLADL